MNKYERKHKDSIGKIIAECTLFASICAGMILYAAYMSWGSPF